MEVLASLSSPVAAATAKSLHRNRRTEYPSTNVSCATWKRRNPRSAAGKSKLKAAEVDGVAAAADPAQVEVTWQIVVGALAGVTPFVVAGIEFSKRIIAQRRCEVCSGSGLVLEEGEYFRCTGCGGFLPWQSWRRFFSG